MRANQGEGGRRRQIGRSDGQQHTGGGEMPHTHTHTHLLTQMQSTRLSDRGGVCIFQSATDTPLSISVDIPLLSQSITLSVSFNLSINLSMF